MWRYEVINPRHFFVGSTLLKCKVIEKKLSSYSFDRQNQSSKHRLKIREPVREVFQQKNMFIVCRVSSHNNNKKKSNPPLICLSFKLFITFIMITLIHGAFNSWLIIWVLLIHEHISAFWRHVLEKLCDDKHYLFANNNQIWRAI